MSFHFRGFIPNPEAEAELEGDETLVPAITDAAKAMLEAAQGNAATFRGTGHYERSLHATEAEVVDGKVTATVYSDDAFAHLVEFGSANNPPYRPLTKAATDVGLRFVDARDDSGAPS